MSITTKSHVFVPKGWGYEEWYANSPLYCCKLLFVKRGKRCSWHYHVLKDETFVLQSGKLMLKVCDKKHLYELAESQHCSVEDMLRKEWFSEKILMRPGDSYHIKPGLVHQFEGLLDSNLIEVSTQHFDEDSYRLVKGD